MQCTWWTLPGLAVCLAGPVRAQGVDPGLTRVAGIRVGHHTLDMRPTGCTVVLLDEPAVAGVDVRGAAPGTHEIALLRPGNTVERVDAIFLSGGSAFGLATATGVVRYLEEHHRGYVTGAGRVPIVPGAIIFDLGVGDDPTVRPDASCGYAAAMAASPDPVERGSVGVGAGATVGKLLGMDRAMKGGVGSASIALPNGLVVAALVVVNAVGDVIDPETGRVVAGARGADGIRLVDVRRILRAGTDRTAARALQQTTLAVVATNASLTRAQMTRVAQVAHDGYARAISPAHTPYDGDAIFGLATGTFDGAADLLTIGALAADVVADAILDAVRSARGLPGLPAVAELAPAGH